jgi:hypothetical protein
VLLSPAAGSRQEKGFDAAAGKQKSPPAPAKQSDPASEVALSGQVSRESAGPGEILRFWITVENRSDKPIEKIWLEHLDTPGLTLVRRCWSDGRSDPACYAQGESVAAQLPACLPKGQQLPASELCESLPAKQTLTVWGDVQFAATAPRGSHFAVLRWTNGTSASRAIVPLGQVASFGRLRSIWEAVTGDWQIGIPVWLAIFSGLYALWKSYHEEKASRKATEFEQRRQTWNLLLLKVHRLAFQHYMPIVSTVQGILLYFQRLRIKEGDAEENVLGAFCYVLRFHWRMRKMKRSGASWYFKDLTAEELIVALVQTHRRSLGLSDLRRQAALDEFLERITEETTVADVIAQMSDLSEARLTFWKEFREWVGHSEERHEGALLSAVTKIITYETNRPYYYWYEELRPIDLTPYELRKIREVTAASEGGQKGISARVEKYLTNAARSYVVGKAPADGRTKATALS